MSAGCIATNATIDDFVLAYESACAAGEATDISSFFPPPDHPQRSEAIVELLRVDLEYAWRDGIRDRLDHHAGRFAAFLDRRELAEVAYEDFRLRRSAGEAISRASYAQRFEIETSDWPELPVAQPPAGDSADENPRTEASWLNEISRTDPALGQKLARVCREMPDVGQVFEGFELVAELGKGAFGRVFLARQGNLANREVALKVTPQWSDEPQHLAQLQHTHIVPIYSLHQCEELQAICMPYLGASTLADVLRARKQALSPSLSGKLFETTIRARHATTIGRSVAAPEADAGADPREQAATECSSSALYQLSRMSYLDAVVRTMAQLTEGLAYAHDHGVIHRDLKPANVLISDDGQPLILDFHIAAQLASSSPTAAAAGGTLPYMAPESLRSLLNTANCGDEKSDIYSIGVIVYELLTGSHPFPVRHGPVDIVVPKILDDRRSTPPSPRSLNPAVSPGLAAIALRCLAYEPAHRYANVHELQEDLQRHLEHRPLRFAQDRSPLERASKWTRRHPRLSSATSVMALSLGLIVCIAASLMFRSSQLAAAKARESLRTLHDTAAEVAAVLDVPSVDQQSLDDAVVAAEQALAPYAIDAGQQWRRQPLVARLNDADCTQLAKEIASLHYLLAAGQAQQALQVAAPNDRMRLFDIALHTNALASSVYPGPAVPHAFTLQKERFDRAKAGLPPSRGDRIAIDALSNTFDDRYLLAVELAHSRRWQEAARVLQQLLRSRPQDFKLWHGLGVCRYELREFAVADGCFTTAITLHPEWFVGYFHRSACRISLNRYVAAIDDCNEVLSRKPLAAAYINRAIARNASGHTKQALEDLGLALDMGTTETRLYFLRAKWRQSLGDTLGAAAERADGLNARPCDEISCVARAVARLDDDPDGALADCQAALRFNPVSQSALQNMAFLYGEKLSQPQEAIATLTRLLEVAPSNAVILASRGVYYARTNQREAALEDAIAAKKLSDEPTMHYRVACIYALTSQHDPSDASRAVDAFAAALQKQPSLVSLRSTTPIWKRYERFRDILNLWKRLCVCKRRHYPHRKDKILSLFDES